MNSVVEESPTVAALPKKRHWKPFQPLIIYLIVSLPILGWDTHRRLAARTFLRADVTLEGTRLEAPLQMEIDGQPHALIRSVTPGFKTIRLSSRDTEAWETNKFVWYGENSLGTVQLKRSRGDLRVAVKPAPLEASITGRFTNTTSSSSTPTFTGLPVGDYRVRLRFEHFSREVRTTVTRGPVNTLSQSFPVGHLQIESEPPDASYELQNEDFDPVHVRGATPAQIKDLPPGGYRLKVSRGDYVLPRLFSLNAGQTNTIRTVFEYGKLNISSEPTNAAVTLNGTNAGHTPVLLENLQPGQYTVEAAQEGFHPARWLVEVKGNETVVLSTNLLSVRYTEAMRRAKEHLYGFPKDYHAALTEVAEALAAKPGDTAATELKQEAQYLSHQQDAREALLAGQLTNALKSVELALNLKPEGREATELKADIERAVREAEERRQMEARRKAEEEQRRIAAEKEATRRQNMQAAVGAFNKGAANKPAGQRVTWKTSVSHSDAASALARAVGQPPDKWNILNQEKGESYVQYTLVGVGFPGAARHALVQCAQLDTFTEVRAAFWLEEIKGPLGITIRIEGTITDNLRTMAPVFREKLERQIGKPLQ